MKYLYILLTSFVFISCGGGGGSDTTPNNGGSDSSSNKEYSKNIDKRVNITQENQIEYIKNVSNTNIKVTIPSNQTRDIYLVTTSHFDNQQITISSPSMRLNSARKISTSKELPNIFTPLKIVKFNENLPKKEKKASSSLNKRIFLARSYSQDTQERFYVEYFNSDGSSRTYETTATVKKIVKNVSTRYGRKNLVVWIANDDFDDGSFYSEGTISQEMIDDLANIFLTPGDDNDIYDWDTNIFGPEWGDDARDYDKNVISNENTIHILIYDMKIDNMAGFFFAKDNYLRSKEPYSNEKIMFYVNARMYGKGDEDSKKETFTTLAHEFQHMINFYQRWLKKDILDPTWFNEMLSETTEDLLSTKIRYKGPRNVDPDDGSAGPAGNRGGRFPYFNQYNYYPVTAWFGDIDDYGRVSAFGTFLVRNYGGAEFLHKLFYSNKTGKEALVNTTKEKDFNTILNKWGAGVMLSDKINLKPKMPQYNFGDFKETTLNNITYKMGSINFFNYIPNPTYKTNIRAYKDANIYTKIGNNLKGDVYISVKMDRGGDITIIAK